MTNSSNFEDLAHHDLLYYICVPQPPGIPNSTVASVKATCLDLITSAETVWDYPQ